MIFEEEAHCMPCDTMRVVPKNEDLFALLDGTYFKVFAYQKPSHLLPRYATDKVVIQKVAYNIVTGLTIVLQRKKKEPWPNLPFQVGYYQIKNLKAT